MVSVCFFMLQETEQLYTLKLISERSTGCTFNTTTSTVSDRGGGGGGGITYSWAMNTKYTKINSRSCVHFLIYESNHLSCRWWLHLIFSVYLKFWYKSNYLSSWWWLYFKIANINVTGNVILLHVTTSNVL